MKIICIGRNYIDHAKELNNPVPKEPVFFLKPDSSLLIRNRPFFYPDFSRDIHFETELVLKICKVGRHIPEKYAHTYYDEIGIGIDLTARDLQKKCKEKGLPWEVAKAFDFSAPLGEFLNKDELPDINNINFLLKINNEIRQKGNSKDMLFSFDQIIAYVSKFITLKMGDLIFTGTPEGVGPIQKEDHLEAFIEDAKLLDFNVK
jgi:2-keto-4-pentenoate hydratase/2-oxohepta-3-ene-1,7-dioic acid hydratase in catechol pathway